MTRDSLFPSALYPTTFQLSLGGLAKPRRKPASFELVLSFVKNEAITEKKVHDLLQERQELARCVAQAYTFAANYLTAISVENMFEVRCSLYMVYGSPGFCFCSCQP